MIIKRFITLLVTLATLATQALAAYPAGAQEAMPASAGSVIGWNGIARRTAIQVAGQSTVHALTSIAFVQAAVYDAVVAIEGGYKPYQVRLARVPEASVDAAVATAAHHVLVHYFPAQRAELDADYAAALATVPDGTAKTAGIAVGQASAAGLIARRQGDGLEADVGFVMPAPAPGVWQLPEGQKPMTPWAARLCPFLLRSPEQFRPDAPLAFSRRAWTEDFNEVKLLGRSDSPERTAEQTDIALLDHQPRRAVQRRLREDRDRSRTQRRAGGAAVRDGQSGRRRRPDRVLRRQVHLPFVAAAVRHPGGRERRQPRDGGGPDLEAAAWRAPASRVSLGARLPDRR
jgi:hypothetical protein